MLKNHHKQLLALMISIDFVMCALVFIGLLLIPEISGIENALADGDSSLIPLSMAACLSWPIASQLMNVYGSIRTASLGGVLLRLFVVGLAVSTILAAAAFAFSVPINPAFPFLCGAAQASAVALSRVALFLPLRALRRYGRNFRHVLIVGTGPRAAYVKQMIDSRPDWGLRVIGFADDEDSAIDPSLFSAKLFKLDSMPELVRDQVVDRVIIAYPRGMLAKLSPVVDVCASAGIPFTMLADLFGDYLPPPRTTQFGTLAALDFAPVHHNPLALMVKRAVDFVGAGIGLVLTAPVLAVCAIAIRLDDKGPVLFRQTRSGLNGRPFTMIKLRTMCDDAEERKADLLELNECDGPVFKVVKDPRITRVGRVLRKMSLDELPQLWNVLIGDMSLVGPRPPVPQEVTQYQTFERRRLSMRPGMTCIWQVSGRSGIGFDRWVQLDVQYIDSWSLALDLKILLKTVPAVLRGEGAC
jgi:exopolysaccharide biosynthesis polyprenyl glycosylphosphotransferase